MKIYGDTNSGNCLKVKWVCDRLALPYSWIDVERSSARPARTQFLKLNGAGQVPTVDSTTAGRWRNPTPSSAIWPAAALLSRRRL